MTNQQQKNQRTILIIIGMTLIPFCFAWFLSKNSDLLDKGVKNHGELIIPVITTKRSELTGYDTFSQTHIHELAGHWLLVNIIPKNQCNEVCLYALLKTKQLRLMLNKELSRTRRIAIIGKNLSPAITQQLWLKDALLSRLQQQNEPLYTQLLSPDKILDSTLIDTLIAPTENKQFALRTDLIRVQAKPELLNKIIALRKEGFIPEGMLLLIDPLGNIMMQYEPEFDPYQVRDDLKKLFRYSQIG